MKPTHPVTELDLLAYVDDELDPQGRARVAAHLERCPVCAARVERLRALGRDLGATFDTALSPVRLPPAADRRIRRRLRGRVEVQSRPWWPVWQRRGLIAQALLAVLVISFAVTTSQALQVEVSAAPPHETLVLGQDQLAPGSQAALRVIVRTAGEAAGASAAEGRPVEGAQVVVQIDRPPGQAHTVYAGRTGADGTADVSFTVPEDLEGEADLVVETSSPGSTDRVVHPITIAREVKLFLTSDKPAYRPGQTIHLRTLALDGVDLKPVSGEELVFMLFGPDDEGLAHEVRTTSDFGIALFDVPLPSSAVHGQYTVRAALGDTLAERSVTVADYDLPDFRVTVDTGRPFYAPGERVTGSVQAEYFFGQPLAGAQVAVRGYAGQPDQVPAVQVLGQTGEEGRFAFAFDLPAPFGEAAVDQPALFDLEVEVIDGAGRREGIRDLVPVAATPILISAVPESGQLKPGVENTVFILTSSPDGRPVETTLTVGREGETYTLETGPYGLAQFRFVPSGQTTPLDVVAQAADGTQGRASFIFAGEAVPQALLLRAERAAYEVGDTLRAEALLSGLEEVTPRVVYLDVVRARQTVATLSSPIREGRATFALDVDGEMVGTLELHAYVVLAGGTTVGDDRLVIVDAPRRVAVAVVADQEAYRPGETARLQVQTALSSTGQLAGQPVQSAVGIGVVDPSVYALETLPPGFARAYLLMDQDLRERDVRGLDVPTLLDEGVETETRAAQDVAARAAWAGATGTPFSLSVRSVAELVRDLTAQVRLANRLGLLVAWVPLVLGLAVVWGLWPSGVLGRALRRVGLGGLVLLVGSPLIVAVFGGIMWLLWVVLDDGAAGLVFGVILILLAGLLVHGWRRRDVRLQVAIGLVGAYLGLGGLLAVLAARGGGPAGWVVALVVVAFLLLVAALATLGQGLVLEGRRWAGWATTALALLLIPLVVYLPFVDGWSSDLTRALGHPGLYAGPVGWLAGCGAQATPAPMATEEPVELEEAPAEEPVQTEEPAEAPSMEAEVTEVAPEEVEPTPSLPAEAATEQPPVAPTEAPAEEPTLAPTPIPTPVPPTEKPTPEPTEAAPTVPAPVEPFPLRQVFPETLYWNGEALTGADGVLAFDLELADTVTTWQLTALASTRDGDLGVVTYDLVVFQDVFVQVDLAEDLVQGEPVTATVTAFNGLARTQEVVVGPEPAEWYSLVSPSGPVGLTLAPGDVAAVRFVIRPEAVGRFSLRVNGRGEEMTDAVATDVEVRAP